MPAAVGRADEPPVNTGASAHGALQHDRANARPLGQNPAARQVKTGAGIALGGSGGYQDTGSSGPSPALTLLKLVPEHMPGDL